MNARRNMMRFRDPLRACLAVLAFFGANAQAESPAWLSQAERFVRTQTQGLGEEVTINVLPPSPNARVKDCAQPQFFVPNRGRLWGKSNLGVRCLGTNGWTLYLRVEVTVLGNYFVTRERLPVGLPISADQVERKRGELTRLPDSVITDWDAVLGQTPRMSIGAGQPIRRDMLLVEPAIRQGMPVKLVVRGEGFSVSGEAIALTNAAPGDQARAKTPGGQVVVGIARSGGILEIAH